MLEKTAALLTAIRTMMVGDISTLWKEASEEVRDLRGMPEIVFLAGSSRFKEAFERESERLTLEGCIVLGKHVYKPGEEWQLSEPHRDMIHAVQFRKADLCHRTHILNVDGYVGEDTYNIVRYCVRNNIPMTFYNPFVQTLHADGPSEMTTRHFVRAAQLREGMEGG